MTCTTNEFYGHGAILRAYAGIDDAKRLRGRIQHGWALSSVLSVVDEIVLKHEPFYCWTGRDRSAATARFYTNTTIIGAPALYDDSLWSSNIDAQMHALAIPAHSLAFREIVVGWRTYAQELAAWRKAHGQEVRVLLYVRDFERADVHAIFDAVEIPQVFAGEVTDIGFLRTLFAHLRSAQLVLVNCIQTACFYALAIGKPVQFYGSPMGIEQASENVRGDLAILQDARFVARVFPSIRVGHANPACGLLQLGHRHKLSPDEIRNLEWL